MSMYWDVIEARVLEHGREDFHLELTFNTGEKKLFDVRPYLERGVFSRGF